MTRVYVIIYVCFFCEISELIRATQARPNNIVLDESHSAGNDHNLNSEANLFKRSYIVFETSKNCNKVEHTGKCPDRSMKGKKSEVTVESDLKSSSSSQSTASSVLSDDKFSGANNYDPLVHDVPIISQNIFEFVKI